MLEATVSWLWRIPVILLTAAVTVPPFMAVVVLHVIAHLLHGIGGAIVRYMTDPTLDWCITWKDRWHNAQNEERPDEPQT